MSFPIRTYQVAGFSFSVEGSLPDMPNLAPFQVAQTAAEELFRLHLTDAITSGQEEVVFTTDDGPGFPEIAISRLPDGCYLFRVRPLPGQAVAGELRTSADFTEAWLHPLSQDLQFILNNSRSSRE